MGLRFSYDEAGSGVAKHGPQKKPFFKFWEVFASKFWKMITLNLIYVAFCLPIVTFGPATAAMTHVMRKFYLEDSIFMVSEFWTAFKKNFKQSVVIGIVDVFLMALGAYTAFFYMSRADFANDSTNTLLLALSLAALVYVLMMHFYIYEQIVALNLSMGAIIKNALLLTVAGIKTNIIALIVVVGLMTPMILFLPWTVLLMPFAPFAWIGLTIMFCTYPVIQKTIINPFYEAKGEVNPELKKYMTEEGDEAVFEDKGGEEAPMKVEVKKKGKVIR